MSSPQEVLTHKVGVYNRRLNTLYGLGVLLPVLFMTATSYIFSLFSNYSLLSIFSYQLFGFVILTLLLVGVKLDKVARTFARDIEFSMPLQPPFKPDAKTEVFMRTRAVTKEAFATYLWRRPKPHVIFMDRGLYDIFRDKHATTEQARACFYGVIGHEFSHTRHHDCLKHLFIHRIFVAFSLITLLGITVITLPASVYFSILGALAVLSLCSFVMRGIISQQAEYRADAETVLTSDIIAYRRALSLLAKDSIKEGQTKYLDIPPKDIESIVMKRTGLTNSHPPFSRRLANLTDSTVRWL